MSTFADLPAGVQFLVDGHRQQFDNVGYSGTVRFWLPDAALDRFRTVVGGLPETFTYPGGTTVTRYIPLKLERPYVPSMPAGAVCLADDCQIYPATTVANPVPGYEAADQPPSAGFLEWFADVHFSTIKYALDGDYPLITKSMAGGLKYETRPGSAYRFSDGLFLDARVGVPVSVIDFEWGFHKVPFLDEALFKSLTGLVNLTTFAGCPPGTVMYLGPSTTGELYLSGNVSYEITQRFSFRGIPHNLRMRPTGTGGVLGTGFDTPLDGYGNPPIASGELNNLFYG
jgi:hypothetical protein